MGLLSLIWLATYISTSAGTTTNITIINLNVCHAKNNSEFSPSIYAELSVPNELLPKRFSNSSLNVQFRSIGEEPNCINGSRTISWFSSKKKRGNTSEINLNKIVISPHDYLEYENRIYENNQFCLTKFDECEWQFKICTDSCSPQTPCIYKCCLPDEVLDVARFPDIACRPSGSIQWKPVIYSDYYNKLSESQLATITPILIHYSPVDWLDTCTNDAITLSPQNVDTEQKPATLRILKDGSIWRCTGGRNWVPLTGKMCIDGIQNFSTPYFSGNEKDVMIYKCSDPGNNQSNERQVDIDKVYIVFLILSSAVLLITLVVHLLVWEKHTVHVWAQISYIASLCLNYMCLSAVHLSSLTLTRNRYTVLCRSIAILTHFFFLSTFTWLSVINYDIYITFRSLRPTSGKSKGLKKITMYTIFAFGIPLIIVIIALTLENIYGKEARCESSVIIPDYGDVTCYLELQHAQLLYVYIPIATLLSANLIFFVLTVYSLYFIQQSTKFATSSSSKTEKQNQSIVLFAKLFLVMGVPWVFEVISWATTKDYNSIPWYWVVTDVLLICQSFSIFAIFVMKKDMCRALDSKYPKFKKFKDHFKISEERRATLSKDYPYLLRCMSCFHCVSNRDTGHGSSANRTQSQSIPSTTNDNHGHNSSATASAPSMTVKNSTTTEDKSGEEIEMK